MRTNVGNLTHLLSHLISSLSCWVKGKGPELKFRELMVRREPRDHSTIFYFCLNCIKGRYMASPCVFFYQYEFNR